MAVCPLPENREKIRNGLFSSKGQVCGFVLGFLFFPLREIRADLKWSFGSGLSALSGRGVWQAPGSCALSGKTLKNFITLGRGKKILFTCMAQLVPLWGTAVIYEPCCAAEPGGLGHVRTREPMFPLLHKRCLVLHLDCFPSETEE